MSGHQSPNMGTDEWLTPPDILAKLGCFDLDPCSPHESRRPWPTAGKHYCLEDDGLAKEWLGRVWMNPPFGREAVKWMRKLASHGNGIALIPARTETAMFYETVWGVADAILFIQGRPHFHRVDGSRAPFNSGAPICLIAYGIANVAALERSGLGAVVAVRRNAA
ncbi:DNA N-6-adenine-methyltransferase [Pseudomonas sp. Marseille-QA0892]